MATIGRTARDVLDDLKAIVDCAALRTVGVATVERSSV